MDGNGYSEEGFEEWASEELKKRPDRVEIIMMEDELGIPNIASREIRDDDKAWEYYHKLKALLEEKNRKTA